MDIVNTSRGTAGPVAQRTGRRSLAAGLAIAGLAGLLGAATATAQDAVAVDPEHYQVAFENDQVRILRITYGPHEKSVMHSHPAAVVVFLADLEGRFTMPDGETTDQEMEAGTVAWVEAQTHQPENLGEAPFELIQIEMKTGGDRAADEAVIRAAAPAWAAAFNAMDADALGGMYWEDSLLFPPNVPAVAGGAPMHEYFATETPPFREAGLTMNIPEAGAVQVAGDLAYEAGTYSITDTSGATIDTGKYIGVFQKRDGVWRYIRDTWNSDLAPEPPAGD
jgi:ketosteroid isomerase-like protein/quercetin dioxygenase-like cupin family protein